MDDQSYRFLLAHSKDPASHSAFRADSASHAMFGVDLTTSVQSLPRLCPITAVAHYRHRSPPPLTSYYLTRTHRMFIWSFSKGLISHKPPLFAALFVVVTRCLHHNHLLQLPSFQCSSPSLGVELCYTSNNWHLLQYSDFLGATVPSKDSKPLQAPATIPCSTTAYSSLPDP